MADLDTVEKLICERYNVTTLPGGALSEAMDAARAGDETVLRALIAEREWYRWGEPIDAAMAEEEVSVPEPEVVSVPFIQSGDVSTSTFPSTTTITASNLDVDIISVDSTNDEPPQETPSAPRRRR